MKLFGKRKSSHKPIFIPTRERLLSPSQYLKEMEIFSDNIIDTQYVPPKIGSTSFGKFRVTYDTPILVPEC